MGVLTWVLLCLGSLTGALLLGFLKDEASAWLPTLARGLVNMAARNVTANERERRREEWLADIEEWPGKLSQLWRASTILAGSISFPKESGAAERFWLRYHQVALLLFPTPIIFSMEILLRGWPVLTWVQVVANNLIVMLAVLCIIKSMRYLASVARVDRK